MIGGEEVAIRYKEKIYFLARQIYSSGGRKGVSTFFAFDETKYESYEEMVNSNEILGIPLKELKQIEIVALEGKRPCSLKVKRDFEKAKMHTPLTTMALLGITFGLILVACGLVGSGPNDLLYGLIGGGIGIVVGVISWIVVVIMIKKESEVVD